MHDMPHAPKNNPSIKSEFGNIHGLRGFAVKQEAYRALGSHAALIHKRYLSKIKRPPKKSFKHKFMAPGVGIEPTAWGLTVPRSTAELPRNTLVIIPAY